MAKQTAVQFLVMRYHQWQGVLKDRDIEEAKAMEKQQIMKANDAGFNEYEGIERSSEQYYNETYDNNK